MLEPVFETHGNEVFLENCSRATTQNPNESYHHIVWSMARKDAHSSPAETSMAIDLAVGIFNDGFQATMKQLYRAAGIVVSNAMSRLIKHV